MRARELRRAPGDELIGLGAACEQDCVPAFTTELALELARPDRRHRAKRAKTQEIQSLELLCVERELMGRKRRKEAFRLVDLNEAAWSRASRGEPR
jgi:hypothetical protein